MSGDRRKEIVRHLSEDDLDRLLAESTDEKLTERLIFVKRLYKGATLEDAADDVGRSSATGTRWARRWNKGGLGLLMPNFGGGRPRSSAKNNSNASWNCSGRANRGRNKRYNTSSTRSSTLNFIQLISLRSSKSSASPTQFRGPSAHHGQRMPEKSSSNASPTRSTRELMSRTTNAMETMRKAGSSTKRSVRTVEVCLDFSTHRIHNRGTTHSDSTPSTTLTSPDRW
ncbi:transposase [Halorubrum distributum JCM 9100]|uniref:Transposase n=2 Tax=Halorubrum distributum TaxID=29283 RepID=M0ECI9_9EURY|nr:transposase [Halorubrum distributum JCM 9100]ELZ53989.1 transposase [Halorubrum distributum JCM 10118]